MPVGVAVPVAVAVPVGVAVAGGVAHVGRVILLLSKVTAPVRAKTRPSTVAPVCTVMLASAMTVPTKSVVVPMVAELPTCQNTLQACAPPWSATRLLLAVISVDPARKMKTAEGSPWASRVTVPVSDMPVDAS